MPTPPPTWSPLPATEGRYPKTARKLEEHVRTWGRTPGDAWAIGHALLALGPDMMLSNGEAAVPWLFRTFAVEYRAGGRSLIRFPRSAGKVRVEPHAALQHLVPRSSINARAIIVDAQLQPGWPGR